MKAKELDEQFLRQLESILNKNNVVVKNKNFKNKSISLSLRIAQVEFYVTTHWYMVESEEFNILPVYLRLSGLGKDFAHELKKKSYVYHYVNQLIQFFNTYWDHISIAEGYDGFVYIDRSQETNEAYRLEYSNLVLDTGMVISPKVLTFMEHFLYESYQFAFIGARINKRIHSRMEKFLDSWNVLKDTIQDFGLASLHEETRGYLRKPYIRFFEEENSLDCCGTKISLTMYDNYAKCRVINEKKELLLDGECNKENFLNLFQSIQQENMIANLLSPPMCHFEAYLTNIPDNVLGNLDKELIKREHLRMVETMGSWETVERMFQNHFNRIIPNEEIYLIKKQKEKYVAVHAFKHEEIFIYTLLFKESPTKISDLRIIVSKDENPIELHLLLNN